MSSRGPSLRSRRSFLKTSGAIAISGAVGGCIHQRYEPGEEVWGYETDDDVRSSPTIVDGTVYFGCQDGYLYAVGAEDGSLGWRFGADGLVSSSPCVVDGSVYFTSREDSVYCLDVSDGGLVWSSDNPSPKRGVYSSPTVYDGRVFVGSADDELAVFDAGNGDQVQSFPADGEVSGSPLVYRGKVYFTAADEKIRVADGKIYVYDIQTEEKLWSERTDKHVANAAPTAGDGTVYYTTDSSTLAADASTGEEIWSAPETGGTPTVTEDTVYVGGDDLFAFNRETGEPIWTYELGEGTSGQPTVAGDKVYIAHSEVIDCVDTETGELEWGKHIGTRGSSPTVSDGTLYVGSTEGRFSLPTKLHAFATGHGESSKDSRVLQGVFGHHDSYAENGPQEPGEVNRGWL